MAKKRILVIEDDYDIAELLKTYFEAQSYELKHASNGRDGVAIAQSWQPSVILLDIMLPDISGIKVFQKLAQSPLSKDIPVVFLSQISDRDTKVKGLQLGAVDYVTKPFHIDELQQRVSGIIERSKIEILQNPDNMIDENATGSEDDETIRTRPQAMVKLKEKLQKLGIETDENTVEGSKEQQAINIQSRTSAVVPVNVATTTNIQEVYLQPRFYIDMILHNWWIILLTIIIAVNASLYLSFQQTPIYSTSTTFVVGPSVTELENNNDILNSFFPLNERTLAITYAEILQSQNIMERTMDVLQLSPEEATQYTISAVVLPESNVLELFVEGPNPEITRLIALNMGQISNVYFNDFYQVYESTILDEPELPTSPFTPTPISDAIIAGAVGLILGAIISFLREIIRVSFLG